MSEIRASHILVEHSHEVDDIQRKLKEGDTFESLAMSFSKCPSGKTGGDLGRFGRGRMVPEFEQAAFDLEVGQVSEPVRTSFGFHLIHRTE